MNKNLVVFDCETTGLDAHSDWIIQLSAIKIEKETFKQIDEFSKYVLPPDKNFVISAAAQGKHQLSKEFILENGEPLKDVALEFLKFIDGCDMAGYNSNTFDVKFLYYNFGKCGISLTMNHKFYDVMGMETNISPRHLVDVYKRYMGQTMEESGLTAHDALSDVKATKMVMQCQMTFNNLKWEDIDEWETNMLASPEGSVRWVSNNVLVMSLGKYRDIDAYEVLKKDPEYLKWWAKSVASDYSRELVRKYLKRRAAEENSQKSA